MIAMRRMKIFGWGFEAGPRVRVVRPVRRNDHVGPADAEREASYVKAVRDADRRRSNWERIWFEQGGRM